MSLNTKFCDTDKSKTFSISSEASGSLGRKTFVVVVPFLSIAVLLEKRMSCC